MKAPVSPPPVSFADLRLIVELLQRKAISFTAWLLFQGSVYLLHAPQLPALPLGYSGNHGLILSRLSPFCALHYLCYSKKKKKRNREREAERANAAFFLPPEKTLKIIFKASSVVIFEETTQKVNKTPFKMKAPQE